MQNHIHVLDFGNYMVGQWPAVFRLLSQAHRREWEGARKRQNTTEATTPQSAGARRNSPTEDGRTGQDAGATGQNTGATGQNTGTTGQNTGTTGRNTGTTGQNPGEEEPPPPLHFRLTLIRITGLIHPGRSDLKQIAMEQNGIVSWLRYSAVEAGIQLEVEIVSTSSLDKTL